MLKGFKDFIMRGNLVELAVAFVIGAAFASVVTATVTLLMDLIGKAGGTPDFSSYNPGGISVGAWLTAVISFLIVAAVIYFIVMVPYNKLQERMAKGEEPTPPAADIALLTEIRDLLAGRESTTDVKGPAV
ncbi:MAG: large conductance mechanosensitive channel protein MscL [Nocardioidaceae bacterium]|nr:large conductance mechanosensitive channel protein MscL [Nocardioidaceae bacterium]